MLSDDKEHFKSYEDVNGMETDESDRPTIKVVNKAPSKAKKAKKNTENDEQVF